MTRSETLRPDASAKDLIMAYQAPGDLDSRPIAVVGAGTLGRRIALMLATRGAEIRIHDVSPEQAQAAAAYVESELPALLALTPGAAAGSAVVAPDLAAAVAGAWLVVEAVPEHLEMKRDLFGRLDRLAAADTILASNSSSFPSSRLVEQVAPEGRARVVNTHFSMPPIQNAVEVMSCGVTDPAVLELLMVRLGQYGGLVPFLVRSESVGFIFNRVWAAIKRECLEVVAAGAATPADVDRIFSVNTGSPVGPFRQMDATGLDVVLDIEEHYAALDPRLPEAPRALLRDMVGQGRLGMKAGRGFYDYRPKGGSPGA